MINQITANLGGEMRSQIFHIAEQTLQQLGCGEIPQDLVEFLAQWNKTG